MTARRGSLRFKVKRLTRGSLTHASAPVWQRRVRRWAQFAFRVVIAALIMTAVGAFGAQTFRLVAENYRLHKQVVAVEKRNDALVVDSARLQRKIVLLHDPDYLVPLIHEQLGLVKPHEVFIVISPTPSPGK